MKQFPVFRMFIFTTCLLQAISPLCTTLLWSQTNAEPIIDMHLHAKHAGELGPPPLYICAPFPVWPIRDPLEDPHAWFAGLQRKPTCPSFLRSGTSDEDLMRRTLENLKSRNVTVAVTDGDLEVMEKWKQASEGRILPALPFDPESGKPSVDELRQLVKSRRVVAFAEISSNTRGLPSPIHGWNLTLRWPKSWTFLSAFIWGLARRELPTFSRLVIACECPAC